MALSLNMLIILVEWWAKKKLKLLYTSTFTSTPFISTPIVIFFAHTFFSFLSWVRTDEGRNIVDVKTQKAYMFNEEFVFSSDLAGQRNWEISIEDLFKFWRSFTSVRYDMWRLWDRSGLQKELRPHGPAKHIWELVKVGALPKSWNNGEGVQSPQAELPPSRSGQLLSLWVKVNSAHAGGEKDKIKSWVSMVLRWTKSKKRMQHQRNTCPANIRPYNTSAYGSWGF